MDYTKENITPIKIKISVANTASEVDKLIDSNIRELQAGVNLPGFRPGKAPVNLLVKKFKKEILENALEDLIKENAQTILAKEDLSPLGTVNFKQPESFEKGKEAHWSFELELMPEIELPEYKGLKTTQQKTVVSEENIAAAMKAMKNLASKKIPINSQAPAKDGQFVSIDIEMLDDNGEYDRDFSMRHYEMEVGAKELHPEIDALVRGLPVGNTAKKEITFPADFPNPRLAGQTRTVNVRVNSVHENDASSWEKNWSGEEGEKRYNEFKDLFSKMQHAQLTDMHKSIAEGKLLGQLLKLTEFPVPETFKNFEYQRIMKEYEQKMQKNGTSLASAGEKLGEILAEINKAAENAAAQETLLLAIAKKEGITVSEEELVHAIEDYSQDSGEDLHSAFNSLQQSGILPFLRYKLLADKAMDFIYENAEITEVESDADEADKADIPTAVPANED